MIRSGFVLVSICVAAGGASSASTLDAARQLVEEGSFRAATEVLEGLADDDAGERLLLLTRAYNELGEWRPAIEYGEALVERQGGSSEAHLAYAIAIRNKMSQVSRIRALGSLGAYKRELARAIELDPRNVDALQEQIAYLTNAPGIAGGDRDEARQRIEQLRAVDERAALLTLAELEDREGSFERSIEIYRQLLDDEPENVSTRLALGFALQRQERFEEANGVFEVLLDQDPGSVPRLSALYQLGRSRVLGEFDQAAAVEYYDRFLEEHAEDVSASVPDPADALWRRGLALEQLGRPSDARDSYRRALADDPDHKQAKKALRRVD